MQYQLNLPIGVIPGGTFNDFTKTLQLHPNFKSKCEQLLTSHAESYDVLKVNDLYVLNFVGLGLIVQNAENVQDGSKDIFGKFSYIGSTVKTLLNPVKFDFSLTVDGENKRRQYFDDVNSKRSQYRWWTNSANRFIATRWKSKHICI